MRDKLDRQAGEAKADASSLPAIASLAPLERLSVLASHSGPRAIQIPQEIPALGSNRT